MAVNLRLNGWSAGLEAEARPHDLPDAFPHDLDVGVPVDHDPPPIHAERAVCVPYRGVELGPGPFEPVTWRVTPGRRDRVVDVEDDDDVGLQAADRPAVQLLDLLYAESASDALIRQRRRHEPVAHDIGAAGERGTDDIGDLLRPVGGEEESLGRRIDGPVTLQQERADGRPRLRRAGLERFDHVTSPGPEPIGEAPGLGALAAGVASLEDDECRHLRTRLGRDARGDAPAFALASALHGAP